MERGKLNRGGQTARRVRVGILAVVSLLILGYGIYEVGRLFDVFAERYPLYAMVENSGGLIAGAPVTLAGQRIGQVDAIRFIPVEERSGNANISVRISVSDAVRDQIREDSRATLRTQGLLGDRYVDIAPGSASSPILGPGDTVPTEPAVDYEEVLQTASQALDRLQGIMANVDTLTARLTHGEGTLGSLMTDDRLYERMVTATTEMSGLLRTVNRSDGTVSRLIRDPTLYDRLDGSLARFDTLLSTVTAGRGTLGRLVRDDSLYLEAAGLLSRADSTLSGVQGFVGQLGRSNGTVARLLDDPALYDQLLKMVVDLQGLVAEIRADPSKIRPEVKVDVF